MKINIELDLDFIEEDYTINEAFKEELKHQISQQVAKILAEKKLVEFSYDEEAKKARKYFEEELSKIRAENQQKYKEMADKVKCEFDEFISAMAYKHNRWGQQEKVSNVGEFIQEELKEFMKNKDNYLENLVKTKCENAMAIDRFDLEDLVKRESKKVQNENAKKVAEFIIKGAL